MDETRQDLNSILPFLPLVVGSSSLLWPSRTIEALKALSEGPGFSGVDSGAVFFDTILEIRDSVGLSGELLDPHAAAGYALFFDEFICRVESRKWFEVTVPALASLLLRMPSLLEEHYQKADNLVCHAKDGSVLKTGLRILGVQEAGIVMLSQELIGSLLSCSLFCLFPVDNRDLKHLPPINFDQLFGYLYAYGKQSQEHKLKCLKHYFERICSSMPMGSVSFERKVLPLGQSDFGVAYPDINFWSKSVAPLCSFLVFEKGFIEDQHLDALEVDFANRYIGGGALGAGCVQEEIRFMINPELIAAMLFLPSMSDNEAIEIVGAERFSNYRGYAASFIFLGDYLDMSKLDSLGRRKTRIVAIDALCKPWMKQYKVEGLIRETNKAFCGFSDLSNCLKCQKIFHKGVSSRDQMVQDISSASVGSSGTLQGHCGEPNSTSTELSSERSRDMNLTENGNQEYNQASEAQENIGVATGNWGCGAFGGDPEIKSVIQWLASSQALRPFILYYTFGERTLSRLQEVSQWILSHEWTVGDLWNMLVEYSSQRLKGETHLGFFDWLLPPAPLQTTQ
ncbi:poly(ADP-ribose) glycohydrolase 1-like [Aristolochia californica]|uniref:poly(ADP-ribose) glycohydrolase 1-like n=1 Tax=Aristolochia californica TaxID=171875 RepID=UPI0035E3B2F3